MAIPVLIDQIDAGTAVSTIKNNVHEQLQAIADSYSDIQKIIISNYEGAEFSEGIQKINNVVLNNVKGVNDACNTLISLISKYTNIYNEKLVSEYNQSVRRHNLEVEKEEKGRKMPLAEFHEVNYSSNKSINYQFNFDNGKGLLLNQFPFLEGFGERLFDESLLSRKNNVVDNISSPLETLDDTDVSLQRLDNVDKITEEDAELENSNLTVSEETNPEDFEVDEVENPKKTKAPADSITTPKESNLTANSKLDYYVSKYGEDKLCLLIKSFLHQKGIECNVNISDGTIFCQVNNEIWQFKDVDFLREEGLKFLRQHQ